MVLERWLCKQWACPFRLVLFGAATALAAAAGAYNANHDDKLERPTAEQTERALEAGERFQYQLFPVPLAPPPVTLIPESYTAQIEPYRPPVTRPDPYDYYRWRWGPRVFWPCERLDPFHRFSLDPWRDTRHDRDHRDKWDPFDIWCPPSPGFGGRHPHHWGEP
jgi:hypothetical protein